ncbi:unnamed protein product [Heterobilharzia americana]|nr:unnamed protein product [Heterobilharzia americana]
MDTGTCGPNQSLVNSIKIENPLLGSSPAIKRTFSSGVDEVDGQIKDIKSPKSKRICKDMDSKVADINTSKSLFVSNVTPLCLSIGNSVADTKQVPVVTFSSPHLNGLNSMTVASPFLGQLIPLSSLPENLICGLSATLMHNLQTSTMSNITDTLPVTSTENHHEMSTANNPPSAWVLTNPSTNLSANLSQQTALNALQPTLFVPVPTLGDSSISSSIKVPQSGDTSAASNPSANGAGILRYPDIIEALKCMAANGNLISSINVPASSYSTNLPTTGNNSINVADNIGRLQSVSHISPSNLSSSESLAALVAHLTASNHSQAGPQPMGIHMPITINSSVTPTDNNVIDPLSFCATSTSEMSNIPSFTTLVSHAPVYSKVDRAGSDRTNLIPVNSIEANEDISFASNDQALDMSVRSITMPSEHSNSLLGMSSLIKSDDKSINLFTGIDVNDSLYKETNTLEQPTFSVVNNVADVINAALKGGLKQRLIQSIEVPVSSLFPNPAHCLTALTNTISSLPSVNETVINSDHSADKLNQNVNCQTECHNNATNIKKPMTNSSMVSSVRNSEPLTFTGVDNKSVQTTISTGALANSPSTSSHVVSLTQLQAIMAALVNASSVSISVPANSTVSGSSLSVTPTCTNALSSLNTPNLSFQQIINHTTPTVSSSNTGVLINTPIPTSNLTMSGSVTASEAGSTSLVPGLNNLTSVCGFTLSGASGLVNNSTTYSPSASKNLGTINSSIKGITVPPGECISLTGVLSGNVASLHGNSGHLGHTVVGNPALINFISGNKSPMQSSVTLTSANAARLLNSLTTSTGTNVLPMANNGSISTNVSVCGGTLLGAASLPSGAISLLDPQQALFAAAAAAAAQNIQRPGAIQNAVNQIALANLKTSNAGGRHIGTSTPVIGLLDPRAALQLRVADASSTVSTILTSASLSNCFNNATYSHTLENDQTETQVNDSTRGITSETDLNHTSELETGSNYEDQMDEEWEAEQDETCSVHSGPQHLCSKQNDRICDKTSGDSESPSKSDQKGETILKTDISCSLLPGSSNKRFSGSARTSGASSSGGRRGLSSFNDPNNQQQLRPHRQNFTPTQNRILTEWYQLHQAKPYPSTDDTKELANISGLSYSQVKKWFANKRARSTSSGLPKPTPPLAPDSSTDPSAAAAIVAAAVAAATSAVADSGNVITSTPTTTVNTPSNVATIAASISDSDAALSLQPFLLKPKPLSFTSQPYADLSIPKTENENETEFVSSLISSHLQINQECIKTVLLSTSNYNSTTSNDNLVETSKVDVKMK